MGEGVSESQFYMWRTVFALAHADNVVTQEEVRFMAEALAEVPFSEEQRGTLNKDAAEPQNIEAMFTGITDVKDQAAFFTFARELVHVDGDYGPEEQAIMLKLKELHVKTTNIDELIGMTSLELEDEAETGGEYFKDGTERTSFKDKVHSFRDAFLKRRFKD